jgi:HEPN domain-containing protein
MKRLGMAGSSQDLEPDELAALLARKATEDAIALREFAANTEIADTVLGFHAQQAIEKWLKAVLARNAVDFEYTHDLRHLVALIDDAGIDFPFDTPAVVRLTEYAVPLRYDELLDTDTLDRDSAVKLVAEIGDWASDLLEAFGQ